MLRLPDGEREVHAICIHLGLREVHRQQQLRLLEQRIGQIPADAPLVVAGDFNDWRQKADLSQSGLQEVFIHAHGKPARTFPARLPLLPLDRIYVRNLTIHNPRVLTTRPWSHLSDHVPLSVEIEL